MRQPAMAERARDSISGVSRHGIGIEEVCNLDRRYDGGVMEPMVVDCIVLWSEFGCMSKSAIDEGDECGYEVYSYIDVRLRL